MKRILFLALSVILILATLGGCAPSTGDSDVKELNIFTWDGYFPEDILNEFEDATGIKINFSAFTSNEEMLTRLDAANGGDYDIVLASDYIIKVAIDEGGLVGKLDKSLIANYDNLDPAYLSQYYDKDNDYTIPYAPGTPLIVYDKTMTDLDIKGYSDLWDESLKDNVVILDNYRVITGVTLMSMGESMNSTDKAKIEEAGKRLKELAPNIRAINGDNPQSLMNGEVAAGFMFTSQVVEALNLNPNLEVVYPEEGMGFGIDAIFVPENSPHKNNAHEFINFILDGKRAASISEQILYLCPNRAAEEFLSPEYKSNKALHIPSEILGNTQFIENVDPETEEAFNKVWVEFKQAL